MPSKYEGVTLVYKDGKHKNGPWQFRLNKTLPNGKKIDFKRKTGDTGKPFLTAESAYEARTALWNQLVADSGGYGAVSKLTLGKVYELFCDSQEAKAKAASTLKKHDSVWRNHISAVFKDVKINAITIQDMQEFILGKYNTNKYTYEYLESFIKFFYLIFGYAYRNEWISLDKYNKMFVDDKRLKMPERKRTDVPKESIVTYNDIQLYQMEQFLSKNDSNLLTAYMLARYTGMRKGEVFALRWSDIDFASGKINVSRQLTYEKGLYQLCPPKTKKSVRFIIMPEVLQSYLYSFFKQQKRNKEEYGKAYKNRELVVDTVDNCDIIGGDFVNRKKSGELLSSNSTKYVVRKIKDELNIDLHFHWLRHTFATNCAVNNIDDMMLCEMLGHEKLETTRKYYISMNNKQLEDRTRERLKEIFAPKPVELDSTIVEKELSEAISSTPRIYSVSNNEMSEGAKKIKLMYDDISSGRIPSVRVVRQEYISDSKDLKLMKLYYEDGHEQIIDITAVNP